MTKMQVSISVEQLVKMIHTGMICEGDYVRYGAPGGFSDDELRVISDALREHGFGLCHGEDGVTVARDDKSLLCARCNVFCTTWFRYGDQTFLCRSCRDAAYWRDCANGKDD